MITAFDPADAAVPSSRADGRDAATVLGALAGALAGSADAKYAHRLHCVALVVQGCACQDVAGWYGDELRSIQRWVRAFRDKGIAGLRDKVRTGRPPLLTPDEMHLVAASRQAPGPDAGARSGAALRAEVLRRFGVAISARQCQRLLARMKTAAAEPGAGGGAVASGSDP